MAMMPRGTTPELKAEIEAQQHREQQRMLQCRCRNDRTCSLVETALGWRCGMPIDDCDICWRSGGEHTAEGRKAREDHVRMVVQAMTAAANSGHKPSRVILVQLTVKHKTLTEKRFAEPDIQNAVKVPVTWVQARESWEKAGMFLRALGSKAWGKLGEKDRNARQMACFGETLAGEKVSDSCQMLKTDGEHWWCGACGCGNTPLARLGTFALRGKEEGSKLDFPDLECPLSKQGFLNESRT